MTKRLLSPVLAAAWAGLILLGMAGSARCQVAPSALDRTEFRPSARALGMGGTDLIGTDDASAGAFNPASIARAGRFSAAVQLAGRTSNLDVAKINKLANDLKAFRDQANSGNTTLSNVQGAFNELYGFARSAGADPASGRQARINANVSPLAGVSFGTYGQTAFGLVAYGGAVADVRMTTTQNGAGQRTLAVDGGGLVLQNYAVPIAVSLTAGTLGISPKITQANYTGIRAFASELDNSVGTVVFGEVHQRKVDLDLGFTSAPDPITHVQYAAVVHDLLAPSFHFRSGPAGQQKDFNFRMNPQLDLGALAPIPGPLGLRVAAEVHNVNSTNGGKKTFHLGGELQAAPALALRLGYDNNYYVGGIGLGSGVFRLDLAAATRAQERVAADISFHLTR